MFYFHLLKSSGKNNTFIVMISDARDLCYFGCLKFMFIVSTKSTEITAFLLRFSVMQKKNKKEVGTI